MNSEGNPPIRDSIEHLVFSMVDHADDCAHYAELLHESELVDAENQIQAGTIEFSSRVVDSIHDLSTETHDPSCPAFPED